jgi:hypothetical protein
MKRQHFALQRLQKCFQAMGTRATVCLIGGGGNTDYLKGQLLEFRHLATVLLLRGSCPMKILDKFLTIANCVALFSQNSMSQILGIVALGKFCRHECLWSYPTRRFCLKSFGTTERDRHLDGNLAFSLGNY